MISFEGPVPIRVHQSSLITKCCTLNEIYSGPTEASFDFEEASQ